MWARRRSAPAPPRGSRASAGRRLGRPGAAGPLGQHEQRLALAAGGREPDRHRAARPQAGEPRQRRLELLRRVVGAADDDEVLGPAVDVELARGDEAEVARCRASRRRSARAVASGSPR